MVHGVKEQYELEQALQSLLQDYRDLQAPISHTFSEAPSALETIRMLNAAHPAVIHGFSPVQNGAKSGSEPYWDDADTYARLIVDHQKAESGEEIHGGQDAEGLVTIAVTDDGFADSVRLIPSDDPVTPNGIKAFVKPLEERMPIRTFLERLKRPETEPEVLYLQSQDGNIYRSYERVGPDELRGLRKWVKRDVEWMRDATGESADAVNLWIGSERSSTSLHHDPYDNIYHVLSGTKTFTLISPIEGLWLDQRFHPSATLHRTSSSALTPQLDTDPATGKRTRPVPWVESTIYPKPIEPIVITLQKGETLFLPAGWWHAVDQKEGPGGVAVAVNYWYTSPLHPERNALFQLAQRIARQAGREGVIPVDAETDSAPASPVIAASPPPVTAPRKGSEYADGDAAAGPSGKELAEQGIPDGIWGDEDEQSGEEWDPTEWRKERAATKLQAATALADKR